MWRLRSLWGLWSVVMIGASALACSSGSSGGGTGGGAGGSSGAGGSNGSQVACVTTSPNGTMGCTLLLDLSPAGVTDATNNCKGTVASSCPTAGLIGCCDIPSAGSGSVPSEICSYSGTAASLESNCTSVFKGTWSTSQ